MPTHSVRAANFVEPMVMAWQMMDAMRQMMEWFIGGSNRNQRMPFGSPYSLPFGNNLNALNSQGFNRYSLPPNRRNPAVSNRAGAVPLKGEGEWLRDPVPYEENFWGDVPYWDVQAVPLGEGYPAIRSGYEGVDGIWLVNTGERWMIQGNQFALIRANGVISKGEFTIKNDWIEIRHYDTNVTILLQFRQMDNLLMIRDRSGAVALLRRLPDSRTPFNPGVYTQ